MGIFGSGLGLPLGVAQAAAKPLAKSGATFGLAGMIGGSPMQRLGGLAGEALNINPKLAALSQIFGSLVGKESPVFGMWAMQEQQRRAAEQAQANREADYTDFQRRYDYERANPKPATAQPYRWESNDGDVYQLGPDGQPQRIFDDPTPRMNFIPDGMGGGQWVPMPGMAAPSGPVGQLTPVGKLTPITGGAPQAPRPFANPPARLKYGAMTSGRRTVEGNAAVGGVPHSAHLTGRAIDYSGPDLPALLAEVQRLQGIDKAFIHKGNHVHAEGNWNVPYFGKRGTIGKR